MKKNIIAIALLAFMGTLNISAADDAFNIIVKTLTGKLINVEVTSGMTIGELKQKIFNTEKISVDQQKLFFNGAELEDAKTINDAANDKPIEKESLLHLVLRLNHRVSVKNPEKSSVVETLSVPVGSTIIALKKEITKNKELGNIAVVNQVLTFEGKELGDDEKISDYPMLRDSANVVILTDRTKSSTLPEKSAVSSGSKIKEASSTPASSVSSLAKKSTLSKPISKMTSREVGSLNYENLSPEAQKELVEMALLSGLESNRNAARKVFEQAKGKINWTEQTIKFKEGIRDTFMKQPLAALEAGEEPEEMEEYAGVPGLFEEGE